MKELNISEAWFSQTRYENTWQTLILLYKTTSATVIFPQKLKLLLHEKKTPEVDWHEIVVYLANFSRRFVFCLFQQATNSALGDHKATGHLYSTNWWLKATYIIYVLSRWKNSCSLRTWDIRPFNSLFQIFLLFILPWSFIWKPCPWLAKMIGKSKFCPTNLHLERTLSIAQPLFWALRWWDIHLVYFIWKPELTNQLKGSKPSAFTSCL